ncbi:MAG: hypothetical protein LBQ66_15955, partial [Planctomycetaceae bacterium]|nr:hypothetical protein [Planctomycetaceae bacterium]
MEGTPKRVGGHLPNRLGVQFQLVWFYSPQRRAVHPRTRPSPLRGELVWYNKVKPLSITNRLFRLFCIFCLVRISKKR